MSSPQVSPRLVNIRLHPIKSLDPVFVSEARINPSGGLALDRAWALYSLDGKWVNGKRTQAIHLIRANYSPDLREVTLSVPRDRREIPTRTFAFPEAHEDAAEWFSVFFDQQIIVRYSENGFPDDTVASGPTIVSTASLESVSEWFGPTPQGFPGVTVDEARERFRATLEIDVDPARVALGEKLPAFWEDQLFGEDERSVVRFKIGEINFEGSNPCARCPVPPRNPQTGEILEGFQKRFTQLRESTLPPWSPRPRFDHFYRLSTNTRVAPSETNKLLRVGDPLQLS
ncbi:MAG TPA: MOSC N-terminal beta barrel domain-containing protein [Candidatus Limnocylindrales bacterium]|nr:MOSC N-terminal beta barrel domain-containing protein [Candidatus Limnocylindrales bacterium]